MTCRRAWSDRKYPGSRLTQAARVVRVRAAVSFFGPRQPGFKSIDICASNSIQGERAFVRYAAKSYHNQVQLVTSIHTVHNTRHTTRCLPVTSADINSYRTSNSEREARAELEQDHPSNRRGYIQRALSPYARHMVSVSATCFPNPGICTRKKKRPIRSSFPSLSQGWAGLRRERNTCKNVRC